MDHKEKEVVIDIENGNASVSKDLSSNTKWGKKSLNKFVGGILSLNESEDDESVAKREEDEEGEAPNETTRLLGGNASEGVEGEGLRPVVEKENERERRKIGKVSKKAAKPPRPPKGPTLDAADMRLLKEISRIAIKKRERMERLKALKRMRSNRLPSALSSASSSSSSPCSSAATISAMFVTAFFFLVLILQGLSSSAGSNMTITGAPQPQPAPETRGLSPTQLYGTVVSDDGAAAAPTFLPPK